MNTAQPVRDPPHKEFPGANTSTLKVITSEIAIGVLYDNHGIVAFKVLDSDLCDLLEVFDSQVLNAELSSQGEVDAREHGGMEIAKVQGLLQQHLQT